jgi:hypothetical protein
MDTLSDLVVGCDYGIKPAMGIMGDTEFPDLLRRGLMALGYARLPQFGSFVQPPLLAMLFNSGEIARDCFAIFEGWAERSEDGDAVSMSFIEFENGEYGLCIYPNQNMLMERCVPAELRAEVDPLVPCIGHLKMFPKQSEWYRWFKDAVRDGPFLFAPSTQEADLLDLAIPKRQVDFYREEEVPDHTIEAALLRLHNGTLDDSVTSQTEHPHTLPAPSKIASRRSRQLDSFFPVTLERLRHHENFQRAKEELLSQGFQLWQISQAACNIVLQARAPELFQESNNASEDGPLEMPKVRMLYYLVSNYESITVTIPSAEELRTEGLRRQIAADARDLLRAAMGEAAIKVADHDLQAELKARGLSGEVADGR